MKYCVDTIAKNSCILFYFLALLSGNQGYAKDSSRWETFKTELSSPWHEPARPFLLWGVGTTLTLTVFEDKIDDPIQSETIEDKPLGKYSYIGDLGGQLVPNFIYAAGMSAYSRFSVGTWASPHAIVMTKTTIYATGAAHFLKIAAAENRPNGADRRSFPSGHTTAAAAFATVVVYEHGWWPYGSAAVFLASLTAYSRINDNVHYFHDVVGGGFLGIVYGVSISSLYKKESNKMASHLQILPALSNRFSGLIARYEF